MVAEYRHQILNAFEKQMATKKRRVFSAASRRTDSHPHPVKSVSPPLRPDTGKLSAAAKPLLHHEPPPVPRRPVRHELPAMYNETYLRVLPRDPYSLFTYWEIPGDTVSKTVPENTEASSPALLRLYEVAARGGRKPREKPVSDIPVGKQIFSQYIRVPEPGHRYRLEYGTASSGRFVALCSSNEVAVPAAQVQKPSGKKRAQADTKKLVDFSARSLAIAAPPSDFTADMLETPVPGAGQLMTGYPGLTYGT